MKAPLKSLTLAAGLLAVGCGGGDDEGGLPFSPVTIPPVAVNDSFTVFGNGQLQAPAPGVLANDTANGATPSVTSPPGRGQVSLNPDGSFTYTPNAGEANTSDSWTYTLTNSAGSSTATVTVEIGPFGSFVDNSAPAGGDGTQQRPFQTLAQASSAAGANPVTFLVAPGSGAYVEDLALQAGQGIQSSSGQATITGQLILSSNNRVANLRLLNSPGTAINATNAGDGSVEQVTIDGAGATGCSLVNATGSFRFAGCTLQNTASDGLIASADSTSLTWTVTNSTFTNIGRVGVFANVTNTAAQNVTVTDCQSSAGNADFVFVDVNTTGTSVGMNIHNNTATGNGVLGIGFEARLKGSPNFLGLLSGNTVTNMGGEGILAVIGDTAQARLRFTNNVLLNNQPNSGVVIAHTVGSPTTGAVFTGNTSEGFSLLQNNYGTFRVERFAEFSGASGNSEPAGTGSGTITDVPAGSLGIP